MFIKPGLTHLVITRPDKYCWKSIFEMVIKPGTYFSEVFGRRIFTMWFALMVTRHLHIKTYPMLWRLSSATQAEFQPKAMTCPWKTALVDMPGILWWTSFVHACIGVHATSICLFVFHYAVDTRNRCLDLDLNIHISRDTMLFLSFCDHRLQTLFWSNNPVVY